MATKKRAGVSTPALRLTLDRARAHWHLRQGLAEPVPGSLAGVVTATGWPRTLGGVDVYLSLRARVPGLGRAAVESAVAKGDLRISPAVRGCIYLVPRAHAALALAVAAEPHFKRAARELEKAGSDLGELDRVGEAVLAALRSGPLTPDGLRRALPPGVVRNLGDTGKKVGLSSTLPPALRALEFAGLVERALEHGRLDSERYVWRLPARDPFAGVRLPPTSPGRNALLAEVFHRSAGPASVADFAAWAGLTQAEARAAVAAAPLAPVAVEGYAEVAHVLEADLAELAEPAAPSERIALLAFEDNYLIGHGGPGLLLDPRHRGIEVGVWGQKGTRTLGEARHVAWRTIVVGDRLAGFWEVDPDRGTIVTTTFARLKPAARKALVALTAPLAKFLLDDLGHARSFSLDTMDEVRKRAAAIQAR